LRLAVVTNIVAPYRTPTFRELAGRLQLCVFYSAATESNRQWSVPQDLPFPYEIIGGRSLAARTATFYPSPHLIRQLAAYRPHAVMVGGFSVPTLYSLGYCKVRNARLVLFSEGTRQTEQELGIPRVLARRLFIAGADAFVGASTSAAERFISLGASPDRVRVAPYALDVERRPVRTHGDHSSPARFLFVGQFIRRKGIFELLEVIEDLRRHFALTLTLVGHGPLEAQVRSFISARGLDHVVDVVGFVDQPALPALYAAHDVFVFPSLEDTFGVVLLEAMAAGLPVISSPHAAATRDFVRSGQNGWVADPYSRDALRAGIETALAARPGWPAIGAAARATVEQSSPRRSAEQIVLALRSASLDL
jgi:glycosyltransferase involved in cell wall biosynthesis